VSVSGLLLSSSPRPRALLKHQPLTTRPIAESVGVSRISEAIGTKNCPSSFPPAPPRGLDPRSRWKANISSGVDRKPPAVAALD
jgi:hypothetical protein